MFDFAPKEKPEGAPMQQPARSARTIAIPRSEGADTQRRNLLVRFFSLLLTSVFCLWLSACAGTLPGGTDTVNENLFDDTKMLQQWVDSLKPGMSKGEVFARLGRLERDFTRLDRSQIIGVIFGGEDAGIPTHFQTNEDILTYLESLEGYRLKFRRVKRKHGIASPIRLQTNENGFDYQLSLVFKNGVLYQKPFMAGGVVNDIETQTIFDYLNPGSLFDRAID